MTDIRHIDGLDDFNVNAVAKELEDDPTREMTFTYPFRGSMSLSDVGAHFCDDMSVLAVDDDSDEGCIDVLGDDHVHQWVRIYPHHDGTTVTLNVMSGGG